MDTMEPHWWLVNTGTGNGLLLSGLNQNTIIFIQENSFENVICKMTAMPQVNVFTEKKTPCSLPNPLRFKENNWISMA